MSGAPCTTVFSNMVERRMSGPLYNSVLKHCGTTYFRGPLYNSVLKHGGTTYVGGPLYNSVPKHTVNFKLQRLSSANLLLLLLSHWNCQTDVLMFFAADAVKVLRHSTVSDRERVTADFFFQSPSGAKEQWDV